MADLGKDALLLADHPVLVQLIKYLPEPGTEWNTAKRETWEGVLRGYLDLTYPPAPEDY